MLKPWLKESFNDFTQACLQGRLPGSVIIAGRPECGVMELALECARFYLCANKSPAGACGQCEGCRTFAAGANPDFLMVRSSTKDEEDAGQDVVTNPALAMHDNDGFFTASDTAVLRRSVRIGSTRRLIEWINLSHTLGQGKAAVINDAHTMPEGAANSILKTFEEPPSQTLIIVTAKSLDALLPTIRSRAYKIVLKDPKPEIASAYLAQKGYQGPQAAVALALAAQAPLGAEVILEQGLDVKALEIVSLLSQTVQGGADAALIDALSSLPAQGQVLVLGELVRELLKYKAGFKLEALPLLNEQSAQALVRLPADHLFSALQDLQHFAVRAPFIPPRAPLALLRAWVQALTQGSNR